MRWRDRGQSTLTESETVVYADLRLDNEMFNLISRSIAQCSDLVPVGKFLVLGTNLCSEDNLSQLSPSHPSSTGTAPARPGRG